MENSEAKPISDDKAKEFKVRFTSEFHLIKSKGIPIATQRLLFT